MFIKILRILLRPLKKIYNYYMKKKVEPLHSYFRQKSFLGQDCLVTFVYTDILDTSSKCPVHWLWLTDESYIKILSDPQKYLSQEIEFFPITQNKSICQKFFGEDCVNYKAELNSPIAQIKNTDIYLFFIHSTFDDIEKLAASWVRRSERADFSDLIVLVGSEVVLQACLNKYNKIIYTDVSRNEVTIFNNNSRKSLKIRLSKQDKQELANYQIRYKLLWALFHNPKMLEFLK